MNIWIFLILGMLAGAGLIIGWQWRRREADKTAADGQSVFHQRLDALTQIVLSQLKENRESMEGQLRLVEGQLKESRESTARSTQAFNQQTQGLVANLSQTQEIVRHMHESVKGVVAFQNIFKSPKLRGQWGETSLEAVLQQYFPADLFALQHYFKSGLAVDAVLHLPNGKLLPIDSKFNWENFERMVGAEEETEHERHRKNFANDVKKKIEEIASKYIVLAEDTVDLALMYVPAESVYYEIVHHVKEIDLADYARRRKIILVSPNTLYLTLSAIQYWFRDVQITRQTREIIQRLARIGQDAEKLNVDFRRLGKHLSDARSSYDFSEKRLELLTERVQRVAADEKEGEEKNKKEKKEIEPIESAA